MQAFLLRVDIVIEKQRGQLFYNRLASAVLVAFSRRKDDNLLNYTEMSQSLDERCDRYKGYLLSERELWQLDAYLFGSLAPAFGDDVFIAQYVSKFGRLTSRRAGRSRKVYFMCSILDRMLLCGMHPFMVPPYGIE